MKKTKVLPLTVYVVGLNVILWLTLVIGAASWSVIEKTPELGFMNTFSVFFLASHGAVFWWFITNYEIDWEGGGF